MTMQLSLFDKPAESVTPKPRLPWLRMFPTWMPKVGGTAQIAAVILTTGYAYGDRVRIQRIEGNAVKCVVESSHDSKWWKNGHVHYCKLNDLWPDIYGDDQYLEE